MKKSFVTLEQHVCPICARPHDSGALLLDTRMRDRFEHTTVTGWGLCEEHQKFYDDGFIALVACDEAKSEKLPNGNITNQGAYRLGPIVHVKMTAWPNVFNMPLPEDSEGNTITHVFCDEKVVEMLAEMAGE